MHHVSQSSRKDFWQFALISVLVAVVFGALTWTFPPDVNEAHYLTKAKRFWDSSFCPGDLFVDSHESHWLFYATHGWLCRFFELNVVAWIGRTTAWLTLAGGMTLLIRSVLDSLNNETLDNESRDNASAEKPKKQGPTFGEIAWVTVLCCGVAVILNRYLNLAGEWFVGGVEGKCYAYGLVFAAMAFWNRGQLASCWICLGAACGFHIVVGLWVLIAAAAGIVIDRTMRRFVKRDSKFWAARDTSQTKQGQTLSQTMTHSLMPLLALGISIGLLLIGLLPALQQNAETSNAVIVQASHLQAFDRLAHHQFALEFDRWLLFVPLTLVWSILALAVRTTGGPNDACSRWNRITLGAVLIAIAGVILSIVSELTTGFVHDWSARLLTLYLFRLADVFVPIAVVINGLVFLKRLPRRLSISEPIAIAAVAAISLFTFANANHNMNQPWAPSAQTNLLREKLTLEQIEFQRIRNRSWIETCHWIRENTPNDAIFFTDRFIQTFKWHAHRGEVATRKDMPQDAGSVLEWHRRLRIFYEAKDLDAELLPRMPEHFRYWVKIFGPIGYAEDLVEMSESVAATYVIVWEPDPVFAKFYYVPKSFRQVFPADARKRSFKAPGWVVYELPVSR